MAVRSHSLPSLILGAMVALLPGSSTIAQQEARDGVPETPEGLLFERDIAYREGHERWVLNVIAPKKTSTTARPAVLLVHGGGWAGGDQYRFTKMAFTFAE